MQVHLYSSGIYLPSAGVITIYSNYYEAYKIIDALLKRKNDNFEVLKFENEQESRCGSGAARRLSVAVLH